MDATVSPEYTRAERVARADDDEFCVDVGGTSTERIELGLGQWCVDRGIADECTAEVGGDEGGDVGEVCPRAGRTDELETEQRQSWDWARIGASRSVVG